MNNSNQDATEIERLTLELDHALSDAACYRDEGYKLTARIKVLEARNEVLEVALQEIAKGEGCFDMDPLTHAGNTIENMRGIAIAAAQEDKT